MEIKSDIILKVIVLCIAVTAPMYAQHDWTGGSWESKDYGYYRVYNNSWGGGDATMWSNSQHSWGVKVSNNNRYVPGGYFEIFRGCHYSNCTGKDPDLPICLGDIYSLTGHWTMKPVQTGKFGAIYDIYAWQTAAKVGKSPKKGWWNLLVYQNWYDNTGWMCTASDWGRNAHYAGDFEIKGETWHVVYAKDKSEGSFTEGPTTVFFCDVPRTDKITDLKAIIKLCIDQGWVDENWYLGGIEIGWEIYIATKNINYETTHCEVNINTPSDSLAPTVPGNLQFHNVGIGRVDLSWTESTDEGGSGLAGYQIYNEDTEFLTVGDTTSATIVGLSGGTPYTFKVRACDNAGNNSGFSNTVTFTTEVDNQNPTDPSNLQTSNITGTSLTLSWNASSDNDIVDHYEVFLDDSLKGITEDTSYTFTGLSQTTTYSLGVKAYDASGNGSNKVSIEATTEEVVTSIENFGYVDNLDLDGLDGGTGWLDPWHLDTDAPGRTKGTGCIKNQALYVETSTDDWEGIRWLRSFRDPAVDIAGKVYYYSLYIHAIDQTIGWERWLGCKALSSSALESACVIGIQQLYSTENLAFCVKSANTDFVDYDTGVSLQQGNWVVIQIEMNGPDIPDNCTAYINPKALDDYSGADTTLTFDVNLDNGLNGVFLDAGHGGAGYFDAVRMAATKPTEIPNIIDTDVTDIAGFLPNFFALHQNYPNPFNPTTTIEFRLAKREHATVTVYNIMGQQVATLVDDMMNAGLQTVHFNAEGMPSGIYFYKLITLAGELMKKALFIR